MVEGKGVTMERLTKRNEDGVVSMAINCPNGCEYYTCNIDEGPQCNHQCEADIVCKLAEYEDAEEQGLLLRLPCPVGTTVYCIEDECEDIYIEGSDYRFVGEERFDFWMLEQFGKTVFLTQEEAEQALKQMGE